MKKCKKCGAEKSLDDFYKHTGMKDGHLNICKLCKRGYAKVYFKTDTGKATEQRRNQKPERKKFHAKNLKRWRRENPEKALALRKKHPEKYKARNAVSSAIRSGKLIPQPCEVCGTVDNINAHHEDYSKPLDVNWLCKKHHELIEKQKEDLYE